jgi:hypothetical protein
MSAMTDTDRLVWLLDMGYLTPLRRLSNERWEFDLEEEDYTIAVGGATWREAIDAAMQESAP